MARPMPRPIFPGPVAGPMTGADKKKGKPSSVLMSGKPTVDHHHKPGAKYELKPAEIPRPTSAPAPTPIPASALVPEPVNLSWNAPKRRPPNPGLPIRDVSRRGDPDSPDDSSDEDSEASTSTNESWYSISRNQSRRDRKRALKKELIVSRVRTRPGREALEQPQLRRQTTLLGKLDGMAAPHLSRLEISSAQVYFDDLVGGGAATLELVRRAIAPAPGTKSPGVSGDVQKDTTKDAGKGTQDRMVWLHATSDAMNLKSFEDVAMFELPLDPQTRLLLVHLLQSIRSKKLDEEWYIRPGTALRCDNDSATAGTQNGSVFFASIPNLHTNPYRGLPSRIDTEEICPERRLDEAIGHANMMEETSKGWNDAETRVRPLLWVRQTWILVAGSCILTYGSLSQEAISGHVITILDDIFSEDNGDRGIRVIDNDGRSFYMPAANRKSFYELQGTAIKQLKRMVDGKIDVSTIRLSMPSGQEITQETWPAIQKSNELSWVMADFAVIPYSVSTTTSDVGSSVSGSGSSDGISLRSRRIRSSQSSCSSRIGSTFEQDENMPKGRDKDNFWIMTPKQEPEVSPVFSVPKLNRKVPEFLSWSVPEGDAASAGKDKNIDTAFREGIFRVESKLVRVEATDATDATDPTDTANAAKHGDTNAVIADFFRFFGDNLYQDADESTFDQASQQRQNLEKAKTGGTEPLDSDMCTLAGEYFDVAVTTLESFVSVQYSAALVSRYFGALTKTLEVALSSGPTGHSRPESTSEQWVISLSRMQRDNVRTAGFTRSKKRRRRCQACASRNVYASFDGAAAHLRQAHILPTSSSPSEENTLSRYIMSPTRAVDVQRHDDQHELLLRGRDALVTTLQKLVNIQNGVVHDSELRAKRGLPFELLDALACVVLYVCALPSLLRRVSASYDAAMHEGTTAETAEMGEASKTAESAAAAEGTLMDRKAESQKRTLVRLTAEAEKQIRRAERKLMFSAIGPGNQNGPESFQMSVGLHYVAAQIACNLLKMPVYSGKGSAALYDTSVTNLHSQIFRRPNKRQIPSITALANELNLLQEFHEWQKETISALELVLNPGTYSWLRGTSRGTIVGSGSDSDSDSSNSIVSSDDSSSSSNKRRRRHISSDSEWSAKDVKKASNNHDGDDEKVQQIHRRVKLFSFERRLLAQQTRHLTRDARSVARALDRCSRMVESVRQMTEILADDQSRVLFIFTTVTVVFLPLSFVATYVSMSGGTIGMDWAGIQRLFWTVAGPLTVGVLIFCLATAQASWLRQVLSHPWLGLQFVWAYLVWWRDKAARKLQRERRAGEEVEEGEEGEGGVGGQGVEDKV